jgi:hypothetical protein
MAQHSFRVWHLISGDENMGLIRRQFLSLTAGTLTATIAEIDSTFGQAAAGPKLTQILRNDLEGQNQTVQRLSSASSNFRPALRPPGICIQARRSYCT